LTGEKKKKKSEGVKGVLCRIEKEQRGATRCERNHCQ